MKETGEHWPIDEIKSVFNAHEADDVLFGRTVRAEIGEADNRNVVEFHPDIEVVTVRRPNSTRQYQNVSPPPRVVEGGILFESADGDETVYISPHNYVDVPRYRRFQRELGQLPAPAPEPEPCPDVRTNERKELPPPSPSAPERAARSERKEGASEIVFGRVLSTPEFYTPKGTGRPRASFHLAEYSPAGETPLRVVTQAVGHLQRLNLRPADEIELKGIRHEETLDRKTGAPLPKPSRWFFMFGASHERGKLK